MEDLSKRYVVVHLNLGHDNHDPLATNILDYIADKPAEDVAFLSHQTEYNNKRRYSKEYGFPEGCFHESSDGHLGFTVTLNMQYFRNRIVEVMGYLYSPNGVHRCVNNACYDISFATKLVEVKKKLVKVRLP